MVFKSIGTLRFLQVCKILHFLQELYGPGKYFEGKNFQDTFLGLFPGYVSVHMSGQGNYLWYNACAWYKSVVCQNF